VKKKICKICNKIFTREWNLQRHLKDIHKIDNFTQDRIENSSNFISKSTTFIQNINRPNNMNTNKTRWIEFPNPYFSNNLTKNFDNYYPNNDIFPYTDFNTICNDEKEFHFNDLVKIEKKI
jgi:hypothetical protein